MEFRIDAEMDINEYVRNNRFFYKARGEITPRLLCKDGFSMSVQASAFHYCSPRESFLPEYSSFEVGYPSEPDRMLTPFADGEELTETVYPYVPVEVVNAVLARHGGIVATINKVVKSMEV